VDSCSKLATVVANQGKYPHIENGQKKFHLDIFCLHKKIAGVEIQNNFKKKIMFQTKKKLAL